MFSISDTLIGSFCASWSTWRDLMKLKGIWVLHSNFVVAKKPSFFDGIGGTETLKPNLAFVIHEWTNLWVMEETSGRTRYNVSFVHVRGDILIPHDHKFARRMSFMSIVHIASISPVDDWSWRSSNIVRRYRKHFFLLVYTSLFICLSPVHSNESFRLLSYFSPITKFSCIFKYQWQML